MAQAFFDDSHLNFMTQHFLRRTFLENVYAMTQHILDDVEVSRCQRNVTWPNVTQHIQHILNEMTRWRDDADAPNKSKTELVRSTIFLVLAWCPGCQGSKTITSGPIGPRVPSGSNLQDLLKFLANLFTFRFRGLNFYIVKGGDMYM